jgi:hypothetical protein
MEFLNVYTPAPIKKIGRWGLADKKFPHICGRQEVS